MHTKTCQPSIWVCYQCGLATYHRPRGHTKRRFRLCIPSPRGHTTRRLRLPSPKPKCGFMHHILRQRDRTKRGLWLWIPGWRGNKEGPGIRSLNPCVVWPLGPSIPCLHPRLCGPLGRGYGAFIHASHGPSAIGTASDPAVRAVALLLNDAGSIPTANISSTCLGVVNQMEKIVFSCTNKACLGLRIWSPNPRFV